MQTSSCDKISKIVNYGRFVALLIDSSVPEMSQNIVLEN